MLGWEVPEAYSLQGQGWGEGEVGEGVSFGLQCTGEASTNCALTLRLLEFQVTTGYAGQDLDTLKPDLHNFKSKVLKKKNLSNNNNKIRIFLVLLMKSITFRGSWKTVAIFQAFENKVLSTWFNMLKNLQVAKSLTPSCLPRLVILQETVEFSPTQSFHSMTWPQLNTYTGNTWQCFNLPNASKHFVLAYFSWPRRMSYCQEKNIQWC